MDRETRSQSSCDTDKSPSVCHKRQRSSISIANSNSSSGKTQNNGRKRRRISCNSQSDNDDDILKLDPIENCLSPYTNGGGNGHCNGQNQNGFSQNNNNNSNFGSNNKNNFNNFNNNFKNNNNNRHNHNNHNNNNFNNNRNNNNNFNNQNNQKKPNQNNNNWYHKNQHRFNNHNNQQNNLKTNPNRPHFIPFQQRITDLQDRLSQKEIQLKESKIDVMNRESDITELKIQHERESIEIEKIHCRKIKEMQIKEVDLMQIHKEEVMKIKLALENKKDIIARLRKELEDARNGNLVTRAILETTNNRNVELTGRIAELVDIKKKNMSNKKTQTELRAVSVEVQVDSVDIDTEPKQFQMSPPQSTIVHSSTRTEHPLSRFDTINEKFNRNDSSDSGVSLARSESQVSIELDTPDANKLQSPFLPNHKDKHNELLKLIYKKSPKNPVRQNLTINIDGTKSDDYVMVDYIESPDEMPGKGLMMGIGSDLEVPKDYFEGKLGHEEVEDGDVANGHKEGEKAATLSHTEKSRELKDTESNFENLKVFSNGTNGRYEGPASQLQEDLLKFEKILKESKLVVESSLENSLDSRLNVTNSTDNKVIKSMSILSDFKDILSESQESSRSIENRLKFATNLANPSEFSSNFSDFFTSSNEGTNTKSTNSTGLSANLPEFGTKSTDLPTKSLEFSKKLTDLYASSTDLSGAPTDSPRNIKFSHELYTDNSESSTGFESMSRNFEESSKKLLENFSMSPRPSPLKDIFKSPSKTYESSPKIYSLPPSRRGSSLDLSKALSDSTDNLSMTSELQDFLNLSESEPTDEPQPSVPISEADFYEFAQKFKEKFKQNKIQKAARELLYIPIIPCYTNDVKKPNESATEAVNNKSPLNNQNTQNKRRSKSNGDDSQKVTIDKNNQSCTLLPTESIKTEKDTNVSENETDINEIHDSVVLNMIKRESGDESYDENSSISSHCTTSTDDNVLRLENKLPDKILDNKNVIDKELCVGAGEIKFNCETDKENGVDVQSEVEGRCPDVSSNLTAQKSTESQQKCEESPSKCQRSISANLEDLEETIKILEGGIENLATELENGTKFDSNLQENPTKLNENLTKVFENSSKVDLNLTNNSENLARVCEQSSKLEEIMLVLANNSENAAEDAKSPSTKISENSSVFFQNASKCHQNLTNHDENLAKIPQITLKHEESLISIGPNVATSAPDSTYMTSDSAQVAQNFPANGTSCESIATSLQLLASSSTYEKLNSTSQASTDVTSTPPNSTPQTQESEFLTPDNESLAINSESLSSDPLTLPQATLESPQIPTNFQNSQQVVSTKPEPYPIQSTPKKVRKIDDDCPSYLHSFQDFLTKSCVIINPQVHHSINLSVPIITQNEDREQFYKELQQKQKAGKIVKRRESILVDNRRNKKHKMETRSGSKQLQNEKLTKAVEKLTNIANGPKNPELEVGKEKSFNLSDNLLDIRIQPRFLAEYQLNNGYISSGTSQLITGTSQSTFDWLKVAQSYPWAGQVSIESSQVGSKANQVGFEKNQVSTETSQVGIEASNLSTMTSQVIIGPHQGTTGLSQMGAITSQVGAMTSQGGIGTNQVSAVLSQASTSISQISLLTHQVSTETQQSSKTSQFVAIAVQSLTQLENHQVASNSSSNETTGATKSSIYESGNTKTIKSTNQLESSDHEFIMSYKATKKTSQKETKPELDLKSRILKLQVDKLDHRQDYALKNEIRRQLELPEATSGHSKLYEAVESQGKQTETSSCHLKPLERHISHYEPLKTLNSPHKQQEITSEPLKAFNNPNKQPETTNILYKALKASNSHFQSLIAPCNNSKHPEGPGSQLKLRESLTSIQEDKQNIASQADCNSAKQTPKNHNMTQAQSSEATNKYNFEADSSKFAVDLSMTSSVTHQDSTTAQNGSNSNEIEARQSPTELYSNSPLNLFKSREEFRSLTPEYRVSPSSSENDFGMSPVESFARKRVSPSKKLCPTKTSKSPFKVDSKKPRNLPNEDEMGVCSQIVATTLKKSQQQREMSRSSEERMLQNGTFQGYSRNEQFYGYRNERVDSGFNPDRNGYGNRFQPRDDRDRRNSVHDSVHSRQNDRKYIDRSVSLISQDLHPKSPKYSRSSSYQEPQFKTNSRTPLTIPFKPIQESSDKSVVQSPPALTDEQSIKRAQNKNDISQLVISELTVFYELKKFESDNPKELFKSMARAITYHFHDKNPDFIPSKNAIKNYVMEVFYNYGTIRTERDFLLSEDYDDDF